jgi:hypothetical protein
MFDMARAGKYYRLSLNATLRYLEQQVGGLTQTSKMPWLSYSIPASACKTGLKLREIEGSVCSKCYACKGLYRIPIVQAAQEKRLEILLDDPEKWAGYMAALIEQKASNIEARRRYFRWHDSGDVQNGSHLQAILWIASMVPTVRFYLPTKEKWAHVRVHPANIVIRRSASMIGQRAPTVSHKNWATVGVPYAINNCPASEGNEYKCGGCRMCWDGNAKTVNYAQH